MDSPTSSLEQNVDLSKLSDKDKQELQQFVVNESQKARIQQSLFSFLLLPLSCPSYPVHTLFPIREFLFLGARNYCLGLGLHWVWRDE